MLGSIGRTISQLLKSRSLGLEIGKIMRNSETVNLLLTGLSRSCTLFSRLLQHSYNITRGYFIA